MLATCRLIGEFSLKNCGKLLKNTLETTVRNTCRMAHHDSVKFIWIDMEMTGLDAATEEIMEVSCIITDRNLIQVHPGFEAILHVDDEKLKNMNQWCIETHGKTGLTEQCRKSQISLQDAEIQLCGYIRKNTNPSDVLYMAGNTIYADRIFLNKYMPDVNKLLHYRMLDVSSLKILRQSWYGNLKIADKKNRHRALDDIKESINELQQYKKMIFK